MPRVSSTTRSILLRLTAAVTLLAFLIGSVGFPVWSAAQGKDVSQPFPCMHRQCGCRSAEQCWRGCCCFTNREKLAWAKQRKVSVPEYVVAAAQREPAQVAASSCCATKVVDSCCAKPVGKSKTIAQKSGPHLLPRVEAATCPGALEQWLALGAIDVVHPEIWQLDLPWCGELAIESESAQSVAFSPQSPPPWC